MNKLLAGFDDGIGSEGLFGEPQTADRSRISPAIHERLELSHRPDSAVFAGVIAGRHKSCAGVRRSSHSISIGVLDRGYLDIPCTTVAGMEAFRC